MGGGAVGVTWVEEEVVTAIFLTGNCCVVTEDLVETPVSVFASLFSYIVFDESRMLCGTVTDGYPC